MCSGNIAGLTDEQSYPHSPDVLERETSDNGFSKGWGMHFMPVEDYWADVHAHLEIEDVKEYKKALDFYKSMINILGVKHAVVVVPFFEVKVTESNRREIIEYSSRAINETDGLIPLLYMDYKNPDPELVDFAASLGVKGIKLHNAPLITEGGDFDIWLSRSWSEVFKRISDYRFPVLWHVTQRLTDSPYTGGNRNTYWKDGWKKGVKYTNQDLLDVFLKIAGEYHDIDFIGAHQLHTGWENLSTIFDKYKNIYVDTTIGCIVREYDNIYEPDKEYLRKYFIKHSDRILFGTDTMITGDISEIYIKGNYGSHMRFIRQLRLPYDELQAVTHGNLERIFRL